MYKTAPSFEVADIFRDYFEQYLLKFGKLPAEHYDVANSIINCRTEFFGGHLYRCDSCCEEVTLYNSCRNRHCPKCQALKRKAWVSSRINEALPVPYFHVVFTIPHDLNRIAERNKREFYSIMFKAVSETLLKLGKDKRHLGGQIGFLSVLHTWGQKMLDHLHIHSIVPAVALSSDGTNLIPCKSDSFLFPIPVMRKLFRNRFLKHFKKAISDGKILYLEVLNKHTLTYNEFIEKLYKLKWVVYVKKPFATPEAVVKYIATYANRVAISNTRIKMIKNHKVTFFYKDYANGNIQKEMTLSCLEFIRRFLMHVLPHGFMKIRYYGFLSNKVRKKKLKILRKLLFESYPEKKSLLENLISNTDLLDKPKPICPYCGKETLKCIKEIEPVNTVLQKVVNN